MILVEPAIKEGVERCLQSLGVTSITIDPSDGARWNFDISGATRSWPLSICLQNGQLNQLPVLLWRSESPIWGWPHVSADGQVCVSDHQGLDYNPNDVEGLVHWVITEGLAILDRANAMSEEDRPIEFANEIEAYLRASDVSPVYLDGPITQAGNNYAEVIYSGTSKRKKPMVHRLCTKYRKSTNCQVERLVTIEVSINYIPPLSKSLDVNWLDQLKRNLPLDLAAKLNPSGTPTFGIVLLVPNQFGYATIVVHWGRVQQKEKLRANVYWGQRVDYSYALQRTGSTQSNKNVLVAGVGAVGARIAEFLALGGVQSLILVDPDKYSPDNTARHILDQRCFGQYKVKCIADLLNQRIPNLKISDHPISIQTAICNNLHRGISALVLATGNAPLERSIVRQAYTEKWPILLVSACVEACGLGGHAVASRYPNKGCLECLYTTGDSGTGIRLRSAMIESGQTISRQLSGCGGFTPYSAMDATKTAMFAVEQVLQDSCGYRRWVGNTHAADAAGIVPSQAFHFLSANKEKECLSPDQFVQAECTCCGC